MIEVPRCLTCKFWGPENAYGLESGIMRECHSDHLGEAGDVSEHDQAGLRYPYDEGGEIETGPDFGCVHHERKS